MLTVDPGFAGTGYAVWKGYDLRASGVFREHKGGVEFLADRIRAMCDQLLAVIKVSDVHGTMRFVVEGTELQRSRRGYAAAGSGSLFHLSYLVGAYALTAAQAGLKVEIIDPSSWKGQLTDKQIDARLLHRLGRKFRRHEAEAVAMGLAVWHRL